MYCIRPDSTDESLNSSKSSSNKLKSDDIPVASSSSSITQSLLVRVFC